MNNIDRTYLRIYTYNKNNYNKPFIFYVYTFIKVYFFYIILISF